MRWALALVALGGCQTIFGLDKVGPPGNGDGGLDAKVFTDAPPAGTVCAGQAGAPLHICAPEATLTGLAYSIAIDINTDDDSMCTFVDVMQNRQGALCVIAATDLTLASAGSITAHGSRPLVLVAMGTMTIAGTVDVSSHQGVLGAGANYPACVPVAAAQQAPGSSTSGGGTGGSFGSRGGAGGAPGNGGATIAAAPVDPTTLTLVRGGCPGGFGGFDNTVMRAAGGDSGGAVYLMAGTSIRITGGVFANGRGGNGGTPTVSSAYPGGGGGGSGGLIMLDAPAYTITGVLMANGGGGGAGGSDNMAAGSAGADPVAGMPVSAASGGVATGDGNGGDGGAGSTLQSPQQGGFGTDGTGFGGGGGGGGGGKGVIRIFGSFAGGGTIVPAET